MRPLLLLPQIHTELKDDKPVFEKRRLMWEENMQMHSKFLDRKEELKAEHAYPELHAMMADLLRLLLLLKPSGVFMFARKDFSPFPSCRPPGGGGSSTPPHLEDTHCACVSIV